MKKIGILFLFFLPAIKICAAANEVNSKYIGGGVFTSEYSVAVNAPVLRVEKTIERLIREAVEDPEAMGEWALDGIGQSASGKDNLILGYNNCYFNPETGQFIAYLNIDVVGIKKMENVPFECALDRVEPPNATANSTKLTVFYTNFILKKAWGSLSTERIDDKTCTLRLNSYVKFGWFFNIFFTTHRYKENIDWRIKGFVQNLKEEAES